MMILARAMGTKQIAQMSFFDYIVGITIGSIAATLCIDQEISILFSLIAMAIFALSDILIALITRKTVVGRRIFTGNPKLLINKGQLEYDAIKKAQLDVNDLLRELRIAGYNNIADVEYVVFETNGVISVVPKDNKRPLVAEDMNIVSEQEGLYANVIIDGKPLEQNLFAYQKDLKWLTNELKKQGYLRMDNILLATLNEKGDLSVYLKKEGYNSDTVYQ